MGWAQCDGCAMGHDDGDDDDDTTAGRGGDNAGRRGERGEGRGGGCATVHDDECVRTWHLFQETASQPGRACRQGASR